MNLGQLIYYGKLANKKLEHSNDFINTNNLEKIVKEALVARNKLIEANYRLVLFHLKKYSYSNLSFMDLIQEDNKGLIQAANNFNYKLGNRFSTYATYWIDHAINRAIDNLSETIRVPVHIRKLKRKINKFSLAYLQKEGTMPKKETIIKSLNIKENDYLRAYNLPISFSIHKKIAEDLSLEEFIADEKDFVAKKKVIDINKLLTSLNKKEKYIIERRFGLNNYKVHTLKEVSLKLSLSIERVRQIQQIALKKLKKMKENKTV